MSDIVGQYTDSSGKRHVLFNNGQEAVYDQETLSGYDPQQLYNQYQKANNLYDIASNSGMFTGSSASLPQYGPLTEGAQLSQNAANFGLGDLQQMGLSSGSTESLLSQSPQSVAGASPSMFSLGSIGSAGNAILPVAGALYGLKTLKDMGNSKETGTGKGYLKGTLKGAASGAAVGSFAGPPGAIIGGAIGGGIGLVRNLFGGKSRTKVEAEKWEQLKKQGVLPRYGNASVPSAKFDASKPADFAGYNEKGEYVNNRYAGARGDESKYRGADISDTATFYQTFGDAWTKATDAQRTQIADEALKRRLIDEHHGTVDLKADGSLVQLAEQVLGTGQNNQSSGSDYDYEKEKKKQVALEMIKPNFTKAPNYGPKIANPYA